MLSMLGKGTHLSFRLGRWSAGAAPSGREGAALGSGTQGRGRQVPAAQRAVRAPRAGKRNAGKSGDRVSFGVDVSMGVQRIVVGLSFLEHDCLEKEMGPPTGWLVPFTARALEETGFENLKSMTRGRGREQASLSCSRELGTLLACCQDWADQISVDNCQKQF